MAVENEFKVHFKDENEWERIMKRYKTGHIISIGDFDKNMGGTWVSSFRDRDMMQEMETNLLKREESLKELQRILDE